MTPAWKDAVKRRLAANKGANVEPRNRKELADALDVDKSHVTRMFTAASSALVDPICKLLGLAPPLVEVADDALARYVDGIPPEKRDDALKSLIVNGFGSNVRSPK